MTNDLTDHEKDMVEWMADVIDGGETKWPILAKSIATAIILAAREKERIIGAPYEAREADANGAVGVAFDEGLDGPDGIGPREMRAIYRAMTAPFRPPKGAE